MTENEICYPSPPVYFLCYNVASEDPYSYGFVSGSECMKSGLITCETFLTEEEQHERMDALGYSYTDNEELWQ